MSCPAGSGFEPSAAVEAFHGIRHADIDLQDVPNQFDPSNSQYLEAIVIWACVPLLSCICILIFMTIYFICVCCCCCCGGSRDWSKKPKICCGILNLSIISILLGLIAASLWAELQIIQDMDEAVDDLRSVENFFNQFGNDSTLYSEAELNSTIESLETALESDSAPIDIMEDTNGLKIVNGELGRLYNSIESLVNPIQFGNILSETDRASEAFRNFVVIAYTCLVLLILVLLVVAIFCGICVSNPAFLIIMVVLLVFLTLTLWVAVGGNLALLIVVGDICSDPDTLLRNVTSKQTDTVDKNVTNYYLVCNETCQLSPYEQEIMMAEAAFMTVDGLEAKLQAFIANSSDSETLEPLLDEVVRGFNGSRTGIMEISSCDFIHNSYLGLLDTLCSDAYTNFVILFGLLCGMCVSVMVLVVTATFHTGFYCNRPNDYDEETEAFTFPTDSAPGVWQAYGTNYNYSSYNRYRDASAANTSGGSEPPKYNDLQRRTETSGRQSHEHELREMSEPQFPTQRPSSEPLREA